jgi:hypothetical protein
LNAFEATKSKNGQIYPEIPLWKIFVSRKLKGSQALDSSDAYRKGNMFHFQTNA